MKANLRIAYIDFVLDPSRPGRGGLSDLVWDTARSVNKLGNEIHIIGPYTVDTYPDPDIQVHKFKVPIPGYQNIIGHFRIVMAARRILNKLGRFDIVHTPEYFSAAILTSLDHKITLVLTEPGNIYERLSVSNGNPYDWSTTQVYKLCARQTAANCAHLIATSDTMVNWWHRTGVSLDKITKIPLGIDTNLFKPIIDSKMTLGFDEAVPLVVYAARLSPENGPEMALRAFHMLTKRFPNVQLAIIGTGIEETRIKQIAQELGINDKVTWCGWVKFENLPLYYSSADAFVFSGFTGGTPRVLLQAMGCGAPVIGSSIGGITDHIQDGLTGILVSPGSINELAEQLEKLLINREFAKMLADNGRKYVINQLSWEVLGKKIQQVYYRVATRNQTSK